MNGLSLRISNVRASENVKKNSETRMDLFQVPSAYLKTDNSFLEQVNTSETIEDQIKALKEYSSFVAGLEESLKNHVQTLANLLMETPLKHAVRNAIARSLSNLTVSRELVATCIANSIKARIEQDSSSSTEPTRRNSTICNIGSCFENFKVGCEAIRLSLQQLLQFLNKSIIVYLERMGNQISPSDKSELCLFIHSAIRTVISCFQQFPDQLKTTYEGEKNIEKIVLICWDLLENPEIPMDTKTNCGILIAMNANLEHRFLRLAQRVFAEDSSAKQMCLVNGIICTIEAEHFTGPEWKGIEILHQAATILKEISEENSVEISIVLGTTRGFFQLTKKLLVLKLDGYNTVERKELVDILAVNLRYSLSHLDHYVDSIRHISRDLLKCTIQLGTRLDDTLNGIIYDYIRNGSININTKCVLIGAISSILKAKEVLRAIPHVPEFLLRSLTRNDHANTNLHINNCYEALMMSYAYEDNKQEWFTRWINPILKEIMIGKDGTHEGPIHIGSAATATMNSLLDDPTCESVGNSGGSTNDVKDTLHDLIRKAIRAYPDIAIRMIDSKIGISFGLILSSLGIARKSGLFDAVQSSEEMWKNLLSYSDIRQAMISADDSTRMSALYLITECHKSTEIFTRQDLECILFFLEININVQAASLRQKITSCMKSALNRLRSGFLSIIKKSDIDGKSHYYYDFVKRLHEFCIESQFLGANFSRRAISFQILLQLLQISSYIFYDDENTSMWNERQVRLLLSALNDSYESNKHHSLKVLAFCPKQYIERLNVELNFDVTKKLMVSPRPNDSLSAAYYLEYLCFVNSTIEGPRLSVESPDGINNNPTKLFRCFLWCEDILMQGLSIANNSLLRASRENPMFGALICIRHLLSKLDLKEISHEECWRTSISRLIKTCDSITKVVSVVTNKSTPEGTYLEEFEAMGSDDNCADVEMSDADEVNGSESATVSKALGNDAKSGTTSQMLLLCSWRTIKEVSLILGDIASRSPIQSDVDTGGSVGLVSCQQILSIGNQFIELLSETKHRGAFEQAYVGFSKICLRLWGSPHAELHQLPMRWIRQLINVITGVGGPWKADEITAEIGEINIEELCITRRSAGIPYIIQALITSELQVSTTTGLQFCMKALLELCHSNTASSQKRTHSLNILRSLFRSTDLGETVGEFISDGIMCAINGYEAESWSERNSSTLLFSALMVRVFGVQRSKDPENLNIRNKMTGRIFFLRYPLLYDYFVLELEKASKTIINGRRSKKLHPLLLLLSRLYPSALEGSESNLKLSRFVPLVSTCSGCAELQTRYLAAKIISIIVSPDLVFDRICLLLESLNRSNNRNINPNSLHGALLQILYLVKTKNPALVTAATSSGQLNNWIELYTAISNYLFEVKPNYVIYSTILDILLEILSRCQQIIMAEDEQFIDDLSNILDYLFNLANHRLFYGEPLVQQKIVLLKTFMYLYSEDNSTARNAECFLLRCEREGETKPSTEYIEAMLTNALLVLDIEHIGKHCEEYDITPAEVFYFRNICGLKPERLRWLRTELLRSPAFHASLRRLIDCDSDASQRQPYTIQVKAYLVLSYSAIAVTNVLLEGKCGREALQKLYRTANSQPHQLRSAIFRCLKRVLQSEVKISGDFSLSVDFLPTLAAAYQSKSTRLTAVECLHTVGRRIFEGKLINQYISFSCAVLDLLNDDESAIRNKMSQVVSQLHQVVEKIKQKPLVATYAQSAYLRLLTKTMLFHKLPLNQMVATIVAILFVKEQEREDDTVNIDELTDFKVFDKNEVNIYGENELMREYCIAEVQHLMSQCEGYNLESNVEKIQKLVDKHLKQPTCVRSFLTTTAKQPSKLIGIYL